MTLTLPLFPARAGPGVAISVHNPSGPVPNDDFALVSFSDPANGEAIIGGSAVCHGSLNCTVIMGVYVNPASAVDLLEGLSDGTVLGVNAQWFHANGTFVDSIGAGVTVHWDPTSGLYKLLTAGSDLAAVLAAVVRTFPTN